MARLFPNKISGKVPSEVARVFRYLKKLPDDFSVWFSLSQKQAQPHFLVLWEERCAFLLNITSTDQNLVDTVINGDLFLTNKPMTAAELLDQEHEIHAIFIQNLPNPESFPIVPIVLFPNVNKGTLDMISAELGKDSGIHFLGKQQLTADKLEDYFIQHAPAELDQPQLIQLRQNFSPEVNVPDRFSPLSVDRSQLEATLTPKLLDLDQEWCMKNNLYLPEEALSLTEEEIEIIGDALESSSPKSKSQLVTGVAGSGKSLVLLYRALLNAQLNPDAEVLVLTHNRPINNELQARFAHLSDQKYRITWMTFFSWARKQLSVSEWPDEQKMISSTESLRVIEEMNRGEQSGFIPSFLLDEIGFIKDNNIRKLEDYISVSRTGQTKGLKENQRIVVWENYRKYQEYLKKHDLTDWHNIAMRFHDKAMRGECGFPAYHCILIDEAQFFAKTWFDLVKYALIEGGQLFLSADPTQGFLKRRQSWISSGIEVRGRTTKLTKPYRNSREILQFATDFFMLRQQSYNNFKESEDLNLLSNVEINKARAVGIHPQVLRTKTEQDAQIRLVNELRKLAENGDSRASILILHTSSAHLNSLQRKLCVQLPNLCFHDMKSGAAPEDCFGQYSTVNAATGLEASIVFLLGVDLLLNKEASPRVEATEREEIITQNTQQLYMAFTRAAQRLVIFSQVLTTNECG